MAFQKLDIKKLKRFMGNGVCDVCNKPISPGDAFIVDNYTFYHSPEYRAYDRNSFMSRMTGLRKSDADYERLYSMDKSPGSAVCKDCIHMFAEEREEFQCKGPELEKYNGDQKDVDIPDHVTSIGNYAFSGTGVNSVTIPEGVVSIGKYAFGSCRSLTSVRIPEGVTSIGEFAFLDSVSLSSLRIPDSMITIGHDAFRGSGIVSVTIPNRVTEIGVQAFCCSKLTSVMISGSLKTISQGAFWNCSDLTSVTISDGVTAIGDNAFKECGKLTSVIIPQSVAEIGKDAFKKHGDALTVYCPKGSAAWKYCSSLFHWIRHRPIEEAPATNVELRTPDTSADEAQKPVVMNRTEDLPAGGVPGRPYAFVFICKGPDLSGMRPDNLVMTDRGVYEGLTQSFGFTGPRENLFFYGPEWNKTVYSSWQITGAEGDDLMGKIKAELAKKGFSYGGEGVRSVAYDPSTTYGKMGFIMAFLFINK